MTEETAIRIAEAIEHVASAIEGIFFFELFATVAIVVIWMISKYKQ